MIRRTLIAAALAATALTPAAHATSHTGDATLAEEQVFRYRILDQFPTVDPQLIEDTTSADLARQLFEGLMSQDATGALVPGVATGFEVNEDNTVYTFTLRDDAKWSNGDPVTAQDFEYAFQRAADPATASPYAWFVTLANIENAEAIVNGEADPSEMGVRAVDDLTLEVTLARPTPYFPSMTTSATFYPAHRATIEEFGDAWTDPANIVSNGAYTLEEVRLNERFSAVKNPEYWDADNVVIERIEGFVIQDENQALTRYEAGEFDMLTPLPTGAFPRLQEQYPDEAIALPRLCSYYYTVNFREGSDEALKDPNVRKALSLAIDRQVITDQILQEGQAPAYVFTHHATSGFEMPDLDIAGMTQADRDAEAKRLWEEAGSPDLDVDFIYNTSEAHQQIATVVSQMWKQKLGVETELENMEWAVFLDRRKEDGYDIARSGWCGDYNEASTFLDLVATDSGQNDGKYSNPQVDDLLTEAKASEDPNEQYTQIEQIIAEDTAVIPIYHYTYPMLLDSSIKGFPMENVELNWYVKDFYRVADE